FLQLRPAAPEELRARLPRRARETGAGASALGRPARRERGAVEGDGAARLARPGPARGRRRQRPRPRGDGHPPGRARARRVPVAAEAKLPADALAFLLQRGAVGAAAEMLGAARRCLDMAVEYAKVREQFGQPIGSFQAIRHKCAEMLLEVENSHAATYYAAWALASGAEDGALAASVAKSNVS